MIINIIVILSLIQFIKYFYVLICTYYQSSQLISFDKKHEARLSLLNWNWKIKNNDFLEVYYKNKYVGILEYHRIKRFKRVIKAGKWYELNWITGRCKEINYIDTLDKKIDIKSLFQFTYKDNCAGLGSIIIAGFLFLHFPVTKMLEQTCIYLILVAIALTLCIGYYDEKYPKYINKKYESRCKLEVKLIEDVDRGDLCSDDLFIIESYENLNKNCIITDKVKCIGEITELYFNEEGVYSITISQTLTPKKQRKIGSFFAIMFLPLKGLYVLLTRRYKPVWRNNIRPYSPRVTINKEIKQESSLFIKTKGSHYFADEQRFEFGDITIPGYDNLDVENIPNIYDPRLCYNEYIRQVISMSIFFVTLIFVICYYNFTFLEQFKMEIIILLLGLAVLTLVIGIWKLIVEYKYLLIVEDKINHLQ